ncbi:hypothetical protein [uncultured Methanobrevibacter sp.]|uniref:hypothetical protein n=1 Tax=uncultured Methanobrevibacter sp. TaxID=253161 RepID=UPI0025FAF8B4|nr:hypothetical protein [uncultured Methanobrevibacter sp.]MBR4589382.1 hypothetical protein [Bacteroidaceae bacterium]
MSGLPHYNNSKAAVNKYEPVTVNMFDVTLFTPDGDDAALMLEHVRSISGLGLEQSWDPINQKYKQADRSYAGIPGQTYIDVTITFTLNLNDANENYIYNALRRWRNRVWNPLTGEMGLKKDYCGSALIVMYNRVGDVYRKIVLKDIFPHGEMNNLDELNYDTADATELAVIFRCDNWDDTSNGLT